MKCKECKHSQKPKELEKGILVCRRNPPQIHTGMDGAILSSFPIAKENDYCHEFKKK